MNPTKLTWSLTAWGNACNTSTPKFFRVYVSTSTWPTTAVAGKNNVFFFSSECIDTTSTYWNVAGLSTGLTYFWRVVAVYGQQTSSLVNSFSCILQHFYFLLTVTVCTATAPSYVALSQPVSGRKFVDVSNVTFSWVRIFLSFVDLCSCPDYFISLNFFFF